MDAESARTVAREWPGEVVWCGWEVGKDALLREPCALSADNPVRQAYRFWSGGAGRSSWDLCAVQWAMDEKAQITRRPPWGTSKSMRAESRKWQAQMGGRHRYLCLKVPRKGRKKQRSEMLEALIGSGRRVVLRVL